MGASVRLNDGMMEVYFDGSAECPQHKIAYPLGAHILDFIYLDMAKVQYQLNYVFLTLIGDNEFGQGLPEVLKSIESRNVHLHFFMRMYCESWQKTKTTGIEDFEGIRKALPDSYELLISIGNYSVPEPDAEKSERKRAYLRLLTDATLNTINALQTYVRQEIAFIMNQSGDPIIKKLTPSQRLYVYDYWRMHLQNDTTFQASPELTSHFAVVGNWDDKSINSIDDLARVILENDMEVAEFYRINNEIELAHFEIMRMVASDTRIKECANCGRYFAPQGRSDTEYCDRVANESGKTCAEVGSLRKYRKRIKDDPVYDAFNKAYKRNSSRVRYKKLDKQDFYSWSEQARAMRDRCVAGEITLDEFVEWLGNK